MSKSGGLDDAPIEHVHGFLGDPAWPRPERTREDSSMARPGYNSMPRHEYADAPEVLQEKVRLLAHFLSESRHPICYSGAGLSVAAGIGDYASATEGGGAERSRPRPENHWEIQPTRSHRVLAALARRGMLAFWLQQNHDGLPQKAGVPQSLINEIHGAWYDPSNPVVPMTGTLRSDLFDWMEREAAEADLCLALGTSLCGMSADSVPLACAERAKRSRSHLGSGWCASPEPLGTVIVSLQQTAMDEHASLRIFAPLDDVFELLREAMDIAEEELFLDAPPLPEGDVFEIPREDGSSAVLDLRVGAKVRILYGPHAGSVAEVVGKQREGHYKILYKVRTRGTVILPTVRVLGTWWVREAASGALLGTNARLGIESVPEGEAEGEGEEPRPLAGEG